MSFFSHLIKNRINVSGPSIIRRINDSFQDSVRDLRVITVLLSLLSILSASCKESLPFLKTKIFGITLEHFSIALFLAITSLDSVPAALTASTETKFDVRTIVNHYGTILLLGILRNLLSKYLSINTPDEDENPSGNIYFSLLIIRLICPILMATQKMGSLFPVITSFILTIMRPVIANGSLLGKDIMFYKEFTQHISAIFRKLPGPLPSVPSALYAAVGNCFLVICFGSISRWKSEINGAMGGKGGKAGALLKEFVGAFFFLIMGIICGCAGYFISTFLAKWGINLGKELVESNWSTVSIGFILSSLSVVFLAIFVLSVCRALLSYIAPVSVFNSQFTSLIQSGSVWLFASVYLISAILSIVLPHLLSLLAFPVPIAKTIIFCGAIILAVISSSFIKDGTQKLKQKIA
eukprot:MONOS_15942.1-p1 / transcript=MONOS_15942.1 / gene=MONOS_15942 / organism=Monocercomonoides_exilis_PA203 / gene_product=unspecified product / transcript_product=unspecified product / location=Mono_scaffold01418:7180-8940(+) / protein_length=409 / sequence_SO=supercontig / SO=protein_coding / is_pseudo=false